MIAQMVHFRVKPLGFITMIAVFVGVGFGVSQLLHPAPVPAAVTTTRTQVAGLSTLLASDPAVVQAIPVQNADKIRQRTGQVGAVIGQVTQTQITENRKDTLLEFTSSSSPTGTVVAVIGDDERPLFPDVNGLVGRNILAEGEFFLYKGRPAVRLMDASKLRVILP